MNLLDFLSAKNMFYKSPKVYYNKKAVAMGETRRRK